MDAGSASPPLTETTSAPSASGVWNEEFKISVPQIRLKKARVMARMENRGPTWTREHALALLDKIEVEGPTPVYDELLSESSGLKTKSLW